MSRPAHDWIADGVSLATIVGSVAQVLPAIATVMAIVWYAILILESHTMQRLRAAKLDIDEETHKQRAAVSGEVAKDALVPEERHHHD